MCNVTATEQPKIGQKNASAASDLGGCHWVAWDSDFVKAMPDPTRMFSILVLTIIVFRYLEKHNFDFSLIVTGMLLNPFFLVSLTPAVLLAWNLRTAGRPDEPVYDRWTAEWYWWNAWLYHMVMDGFTGTFSAIPVIVQQYRVLDRRFTTHHSVPWTVGLIELTLMAPLCFACCYCVKTQHPLRFPLEIIVSTMHAFGMVLFIVAEVQEGQFNVPANDPVGIPGNRWGNVKFLDFDHFTYYWFGFWFCNLIWGLIPYYRILRGVQECQRVFQSKEKIH